MADSEANSYPPAGESFLNSTTQLLVDQQFAAAARLVNARFAGQCLVSFGIAHPREIPLPSVIWKVESRFSSRLLFSNELFPSGYEWQFARNLLMALPLVVHYHAEGAPELGAIVVNLDDNGTRPGLSFCASSEEPVLIPDVGFMDSKGYQGMRDHFARNFTPWDVRKPVAFWRGATSGVFPVTGWRDLPRLRLCLLASQESCRELFDVGISQVAQISDQKAGDEIHASGLVKDFVPAADWNRYRYHIDVDGNTNAFIGFFIRMMTGSPVFKVGSPQGFRQWYYGRLVPWLHYVPVAPDMSDLPDKVRWLKSHDELACAIGARAQEFTVSLEYGREMKSAVRRVAAAILAAKGATPSAAGSKSQVATCSMDQVPAGYRSISRFVRARLQAPSVLDIGYKGSRLGAQPIVPWATGIDLGFPRYDGVHLPVPDESQDAIFASHCLEHIEQYKDALTDWYRALRVGGHLIIMAPHQYLYERKAAPPSRFAADHKRFYTPRSLLEEIDAAFPIGGWRLRSLRDVDEGFDYTVAPEEHARGLCEIELVIQKIAVPAYATMLVERQVTGVVVAQFAALVLLGILAVRRSDERAVADAQVALKAMLLPPYTRLATALEGSGLKRSEVVSFLSPVIADAPLDEEWYLAKYGDIRDAVTHGRLASGRAHFVSGGYFEGRLAGPLNPLFE